MNLHSALVWLLALSTLALAPLRGAETAVMQLEVDAREISRRLLHARQEIPVQPGPLALWYPKWIPGTHAPGGPIENLGGLWLETPAGEPIRWRRDETEAWRIECTIPEGVETLIVKLDYICNQPTENSSGVDSSGTIAVGFLNWNTCLFYPEEAAIEEVQVRARLLLPPRWRFGTALTAETEEGGVVVFRPETLGDLVDSPVVLGEHFRTVELKPKDFPPTFMHLAAEAPAALQLEERVVALYRNVASEAGALFGGAHFQSYHWLVTCSDELGYNGVEHLASSYNAVRERDLIDDRKRQGWVAMLLPHEFVHSWCGKHRRPAGMIARNFHTPDRLSLLWVYEGLTQYLGDILEVRAGLTTTNQYLTQLAGTTSGLMHTTGRRWRSLEDTAIASHLLRAGSRSWGQLRRSQDYYSEGMLLWLEADAIIREVSAGRRSLDDFCQRFMGPQRQEKIVPYDRAEVVQTLRELADFDWEKFIHDRVDVPQEALPLTSIERCGYRLQYSTKPSESQQELEREAGFVAATDSIGLAFGNDGQVLTVVPGMPGDQAGVAPEMVVQAVNGRRFSPDRLRDAIADSVTKRRIELLIVQGDLFRTITIPYAGGPKYLELVRDPNKPDLLAEILRPRSTGAREEKP